MFSLIQKPAPDFTADAVMPNNEFSKITLSSFKGEKRVCLFFYPLDFTFVCPSEILAFSHRISEFEKRNVQVLGVSVDSQFTHLAWRKTPVDNGGLGHIHYPLVADLSKDIARDYGVLVGDAVALRGTFIIDTSGIVRHATLNDIPIGRNVDEMLRVVDAMDHHEKHGEVCPAGWQKGDAAMRETDVSVANYLKEHAAKL